jgi:thymidylate kinase
MCEQACEGAIPNLNVLIDIPLEVGEARRTGQGNDRIESGGKEFMRRIHQGYHEAALYEGGIGPTVLVNGLGEVEEVSRRVLSIVLEKLLPFFPEIGHSKTSNSHLVLD